MNAALDAEFGKAADAGNLELADMWHNKKNFYADTGGVAWESDGKAKTEWRKKHSETDFPERFTETLSTAKARIDSAVANLRKDYDSLVQDYTKERKLTLAKELRAEFEALSSRTIPRDSSPSGGQQSLGPKRVIDRSDTYVLTVEMSASGEVTVRTGRPDDRSKVANASRKQLPGGVWECDYVFADPKAIKAFSSRGSVALNPKTALLEIKGEDFKRRTAGCSLKARVSTPFVIEIEHAALPPDTALEVYVAGNAVTAVKGFAVQLLHWEGKEDGPEVRIVSIPWNIELGKTEPMKTLLAQTWSGAKPWRHSFEVPVPDGGDNPTYSVGASSGPLGPAAAANRPVSLARFSAKGRMIPLFGLQLQSEEGGPISVAKVLPDLPALKAGVRDGDLLLSINGRAPANLAEALKMLADVTFEEECLLTLQRGDEQKNIVMKASWD